MVTSIQDIVTGYMESQPTIRIDALTYGVLGCVIGVKTLLYGICSKLSDKSPSVDALAQDHRNDVATNTATIIAVALAMNFKYLWVLDPVCAFLLATLIVTNWAITGKEYIQQMTGKVAEPAILSQLTFIACNHHPAIKAVDTVRAYHVGSKVLAGAYQSMSFDILAVNFAPSRPLLLPNRVLPTSQIRVLYVRSMPWHADCL